MTRRLRPSPGGLPRWTAFERGTNPPATPEQVKAAAAAFGVSHDDDAAAYRGVETDEVWLNSRYQVNIRRDVAVGPGWPDMVWLSIKRRDKARVGPERYRDFLRIKNELLGPDFEAVELYPADERDVDTANQYHLWALADPTMRFPFGFTEGKRCGLSAAGAVQEPFDREPERP